LLFSAVLSRRHFIPYHFIAERSGPPK
jgi:hypothetical protein